jgi:adenylate cyclase
MPSDLPAPARRVWSAEPAISWLLSTARHLDQPEDIIPCLGRRLRSSGAPLSRLRLAMRILHPLTTAVSALWEHGSPAVQLSEAPHGLEERPAYAGSPFAVISRTGRPYRRSLRRRLAPGAPQVLHELRAQGASDYFALPLTFSEGPGAILAFASDHPEGFCASDLDGFHRIAAVLAPIVEVMNLRRLSRAVAQSYLGHDTGLRVLGGQITLGDIQRLDAAILLSDIRDWSGLNLRLGASHALHRANRYFEILGTAIEANGGEVVKFLGDGLLAVFARGGSRSQNARALCSQAFSASQRALRSARAIAPPLGLRFGIGLHYGQVLYGNVGFRSRLDFTIMGQAVNVAARIESLCSELDQPILFSKTVANNLSTPCRQVALRRLKGQERSFAIMAPLAPPAPAQA